MLRSKSDSIFGGGTRRASREQPDTQVGDTGVAGAELGLGAAALSGDRTLLERMLEMLVFQPGLPRPVTPEAAVRLTAPDDGTIYRSGSLPSARIAT